MLLRLAELDVAFNLAKLFALVVLGFWFLSYFETVAWVVLIAAIIPWVDAFSVWRGPTEYVVSEQPGVFEDLSIAFRVPGEEGSRESRPAGRHLLRALPRRGCALRPARGLDVDRDDCPARGDARSHSDDGRGRPAGAARSLRGLPAPERRPALA